jgi:hypothetical protein
MQIGKNTYSSTDDEESFFLLMYPLGNLSRALYQRVSIRVGLGNAVELEYRGHPSE